MGNVSVHFAFKFGCADPVALTCTCHHLCATVSQQVLEERIVHACSDYDCIHSLF